MELKRKCKKINKYVTIIGKKSYILNRNNLYPAVSRFVIRDCKNHSCKYYRSCKLRNFYDLH